MILTKDNLISINIESFIEKKILSDNIEKLLIIVPTNRKLRDLKKKIINSYKSKPISKINIETFTTVSQKILKEHSNFTILSEAASTVLIKDVATQLELSYFAAYSKGIPFGTLDRIKNVISEYKKHGIAPSVLLSESEKLSGGEKNKAIDIASIYKLYLEKCKTFSALEIGDIYYSILELNSEQFKNYFFTCFNEVESIMLSGFDDFTSQEIDILDSLSNTVNSKLIVNFDYYGKNGNLFSHLDESFNKLIDKGFKIISDETPLGENNFRNIIRSKLFNDRNVIINNSYEKCLFKSEPLNRIDEVENIAKIIKHEILTGKIKPEKICVAFNLVNKYANIFRDVFNKYGIPYNLTDRISLKTSAPVIAAVSLLELIENDFYYHDLARVLTNGFLQFGDVDFNNLISVASELKITSNLNTWENAIDDSLKLLKYRVEVYEFERNKLERRYNKAKRDIKFLADLLVPFRKKITGKEFLLNFKKLLLNLKLPMNVLTSSNGKEEELIKALTVLLQTLTEVLLLTDIQNPEKKYPLQYFLEQIKTITNWARFNIKEKSDYGVLITSVNEIRGLTFDYLFLGGLNDGDFPTRYSPEIFFSGSFQKKDHKHQTEERYHFYQTLCVWNKKLFLSIPQKDSDSELVESTFVKDLEKLFSFTPIERIHESQIFSKEKLLIAYGQNEDNINLENELNNLGINTDRIKLNSKVRDKRIENPFMENPYSGYIEKDNGEISDFLEVLGNREFSVSQLETFAKCPFKYFSERILRLEFIEEPSEEVEPIELGNVLHSILHDFYEKVFSEKIIIGPQGTKEFTKLKNILFEIAEDKINELNLNSPMAFFEKEKILGIQGSKENSILFKFLKTETETDTNFNPKLFEYSFGKFSDSNINDIPALQIEKLKLRGKIDRIDFDESNSLFNVIDYKLKGKKPTAKELLEGLALQLPVYLMAGEHILNSLENLNAIGSKMIIYSLNYKDDKFGPTDVKISSKRKLSEVERQNMNEGIINNTKEKLIEYHGKINNGSFHLSQFNDREEKVCRFCDFKSLCRVKEVFEA